MPWFSESIGKKMWQITIKELRIFGNKGVFLYCQAPQQACGLELAMKHVELYDERW